MPFRRYVAARDSQTEGLGDGGEATGYRGWADRLAAMIAEHEPELGYANLAVRGLRTAQVRAGQTGPALALRPDLVSVMSGVNDVLRPGFDLDDVAADLDAMVAEFTASGATVLTVTFPDVARMVPVARRLLPRVVALNARIRELSARHGAVLVDFFPHAVTTDPRLWSPDRVHASPIGHARIAAAAAHALELPGSDASWTEPLPVLTSPGRWARARTEAARAAGFLGPWVWRRVRGRTPADGRTAKRPELGPLGQR